VSYLKDKLLKEMKELYKRKQPTKRNPHGSERLVDSGRRASYDSKNFLRIQILRRQYKETSNRDENEEDVMKGKVKSFLEGELNRYYEPYCSNINFTEKKMKFPSDKYIKGKLDMDSFDVRNPVYTASQLDAFGWCKAYG
jgi:hypothetical protein